MASLKVCAHCKKEKELEAFSKCKHNRDGLNYSCRSCLKKYVDRRKARYTEPEPTRKTTVHDKFNAFLKRLEQNGKIVSRQYA